MKVTTFAAHLVSVLKIEMSDMTELHRALREQSAHFDPESEVNRAAIEQAVKSGVGFDADFLKGRTGPGGGVDVDPFRAAFLLLAAAMNGPRKESAIATWRAWHLNQEGSVLSGVGDDFQGTFTVCPLTGDHLFGEALRTIIDDRALAARVQQVRISTNRTASILFDGDNVSKFNKGDFPAPYVPVERETIIHGLVFRQVAQIIRDEI